MMGGGMSVHLGILAYGSLINEPGEEIAAATVEIIRDAITTPFPVEFARSSHIRAGAPTLVPVATGGRHIPARIFVLRGDVSDQEAREMLWRRETGKKGSAPSSFGRSDPGPNDVVIDEVVDFHGIRKVLYTRIRPNIDPLTPQHLAELALRSACCTKVAAKGRDGISYLMAALGNAAHTRLSAAYERELLHRTHAVTLTEALQRMRSSGGRLTGGA
jgi:hypothetical protein